MVVYVSSTEMSYDSEAASVEVTVSPARGWASPMRPFAKPAGGMLQGVSGWSFLGGSKNSCLGTECDLGVISDLPELHSHQLDGNNGLGFSRLLSKRSLAVYFLLRHFPRI